MEGGSAKLNLRWEALPGLWGWCLGAWVLGSKGCACRRGEKEFGFRGIEGRILLLLSCGVRIEVPQDHTVRVVMLTWVGWLLCLALCDIS